LNVSLFNIVSQNNEIIIFTFLVASMFLSVVASFVVNIDLKSAAVQGLSFLFSVIGVVWCWAVIENVRNENMSSNPLLGNSIWPALAMILFSGFSFLISLILLFYKQTKK
jgi:hypothetical protein